MQGAKKEEINLLPVRRIDVKLLEEYDPASDLRKYSTKEDLNFKVQCLYL